jgi:5-methylcytosine-specific restriction enzyme A
MRDSGNSLFVPGQIYRRRELHARFGGQRQGGISTPLQHALIFIFTGESGEQYGYSDGWQPSGLYFYTGEGQRGDMTMRGGNKAIRSHIQDGKDIHLFKQAHRSHTRYLGQFVCTGHHIDRSPDVGGELREAIVFELISIDMFNLEEEANIGENDEIEQIDRGVETLQLREEAFSAASEGLEPIKRLANWRKRSELIRRYVLRRGNGICEGCSAPAPFLTTKGDPYLEPHHIRRLSDGGPDNPRWIAAVCANCHRRAHYSIDAADFNAHLILVVNTKEENAAS